MQMYLLPSVTSLVDGTSTSRRPNASRVRDFNQACTHYAAPDKSEHAPDADMDVILTSMYNCILFSN